MIRSFRKALCILLILVPSTRAEEKNAKADPAGIAFFEKNIRPLFVEQCVSCHGGEKTRGGLKLTSRTAALKGGDTGPGFVAGKPKESLLVHVLGYDGDVKMPPKGKLKEQQIKDITAWVEMGALA